MCQLLGLSTRSPVRLSFSWKHFALRGSEAGEIVRLEAGREV